MSLQLTVYSRAYCHLCHDMLAALAALQAHHDFRLEIIDVDENETLEARYGEFVPVLADEDGKEICHYRLDPTALTAYFETAQ